MSTITVMQSDVGRLFSGVLTSDGEVVDLSDGDPVVKFIMWDEETGVIQVEETADLVGDGSTGEVTYTSASGDLDTPGKYRQQWEVTWSPTSIGTFPNNRYNYVIILPDGNTTVE